MTGLGNSGKFRKAAKEFEDSLLMLLPVVVAYAYVFNSDVTARCPAPIVVAYLAMSLLLVVASVAMRSQIVVVYEV